MVGGLASTTIEVTCEGRCRGVTAAALARGRVARIECGRGTRVAGGGVRAGEHAEVRRRLVALLAARDRGCHGGVAGDSQRRRIDVRRTDVEATGVDVGGRVAARAVAVEAAVREVVAGSGDDGDRVAGRWSGERTGARSVTGETTRDTLVDAGDGVERVVARGGVALGARR